MRSVLLCSVLALLASSCSFEQNKRSLTKTSNQGNQGFLVSQFSEIPESTGSKRFTGQILEAFLLKVPVVKLQLPIATNGLAERSLEDNSLVDELRLVVCEENPQNGCQPLQVLDANSAKANRLTLAPNGYKVTWTADSQTRSKSLFFKIKARGLDLVVLRKLGSQEAISFHFVVYNDPRVRAHILKDKGQDSISIAQAIRSEFQIDAVQTATILALEAFDSTAIVRALSQVFQTEMLDITRILRSLGFNAEQIALGLHQALGLRVVVVGQCLQRNGFTVAEVYEAIKNVFSIAVDDANDLLVEMGFAPREVVEITYNDLKTYYTTLVQNLGPVFSFHPEEKYLPSSVEYYLSNSMLEDNLGRRWAVNKENLYRVGKEAVQSGASDVFLHVNNDAKLPGNVNEAPAYVHVLKQREFTDLQFWVFYPYNGAGTIRLDMEFNGISHQAAPSLVDPVGEHFSDWELATLRINNRTKTVDKVFLSGHGDIVEHSLSEFQRDAQHRIMILPSLNGHANEAAVANNKYPLFYARLDVPGFEKEFCIDLGELGKPCLTFKFKGFKLADIGAFGLNRTALGGATLPAWQRFEILGIYDGNIDQELLMPVDNVHKKHWIEFEGKWTHSWQTHLSNQRMQQVLATQLKPFADIVCVGDTFKNSLSGCGSLGEIGDVCAPLKAIAIDLCSAVFKPAMNQIPQSWIDAAVGGMMGGIDAGRPGSPGIRYCDFSHPSFSPASQWRYDSYPNEECK